MLKRLAVLIILACGNTEAWADAQSDCEQSRDMDRKISGCTQYIQQNLSDKVKLAIAYSNRGNAYDNKGNYDRAIADYTNQS